MSKEYDLLSRSFIEGRLAHALIMASPERLLSRDIGMKLAKLALCEKPSANACGQCHSCQLFDSNSHPDCMMIEGEGKTETIKVDQIRVLGNFLHETASVSSYRVVLIENSDNMNQQAQNALLKSLEEPGENTLLLLTTTNAHFLLPTIRSRCQLMHLQCKTEQQVSGQLIDLIKKRASINEIAKAFESEKFIFLDTLFSIMQSHLASINGLTPVVTIPSASVDPDAAFAFCDKILKIKAALKHKISLSAIVMMEDLMIDYYRVTKGEAYAVDFVSA